jgi:hypothetical protein
VDNIFDCSVGRSGIFTFKGLVDFQVASPDTSPKPTAIPSSTVVILGECGHVNTRLGKRRFARLTQCTTKEMPDRLSTHFGIAKNDILHLVVALKHPDRALEEGYGIGLVNRPLA